MKTQKLRTFSLRQFHETSSDELDVQALAEEAKRKIAEAEKTSQALVEEGKKQAEALKEEAYEKGYQEGLAQGEEEGKVKLQQDNASLVTSLKNTLEEIYSLKVAILNDVESELVKLVLFLAENLVFKELETDPGIITHLIKESIKYLSDEEEITIKLNPADLSILEEYMAEGVAHEGTDNPAGIAQSYRFRLEDDDSISQGGCLISTSTKILDARLETRLLEASKALLSKSRNLVTE